MLFIGGTDSSEAMPSLGRLIDIIASLREVRRRVRQVKNCWLVLNLRETMISGLRALRS